jgi:hypothetical protein
MAYTFDERIVSDLHKDARGFRPSVYWWDQWKLCSDDQKQVMLDSLCEELEAEIAREKTAQKQAYFSLMDRIDETLALGAGDVITALKWIMEAEQFGDYDLQYGAYYFCYHFGLAYSNKNLLPIQTAMNEMLMEVV